jgi:ribonuclease E
MHSRPAEAPSQAQRTPRDGEGRRANGNGERHGERQRPERIWDVPSATQAEDTSPPLPAVPASFSTPHATRVSVPSGSISEPKDATPPRRRHETDSSEPRIERVVVRPDQSVNADEEATSQPQRKGWWQRKFGGE